MSACVTDVPQQGKIPFGQMKPGQIGKFVYNGREVIVLRIFEGVVNLCKPVQTWGLRAEHTVELLPEGTTVEITAEAEKDYYIES